MNVFALELKAKCVFFWTLCMYDWRTLLYSVCFDLDVIKWCEPKFNINTPSNNKKRGEKNDLFVDPMRFNMFANNQIWLFGRLQVAIKKYKNLPTNSFYFFEIIVCITSTGMIVLCTTSISIQFGIKCVHQSYAAQ